MILKGILPDELSSCLHAIQDDYDNNLSFNRFDESHKHKKSLEGLKAVDMSGEVLIGKDKTKTILVNVDHDLHTNPFIECQEYHCAAVADVYDVAVYEQGDVFAARKGLVSPIHVLDFLKHNREIHAVQFTIRVQDSKGAGARRSWSGRRTVSACWHAHRDLMMKIFEMNPAANLKTALAHYKNKDSFYELYPETANVNVGSQFQPAYAEALCDC